MLDLNIQYFTIIAERDFKRQPQLSDLDKLGRARTTILAKYNKMTNKRVCYSNWTSIGYPTLVMGPGQNFLTRVGSAIYGLGLNLEIFS